MNILILGGNSMRHKQWIRDLGSALEQRGHTVVLHDYAHWVTGAPTADIDYEIEQITDKMAQYSDYIVIAKSIGTVIAALAVARTAIRPTKCIMLGVPYDGVAGRMPTFGPALTLLPPTVFVQNEHDPYGNATGLQSLLDAHHPADYRLVTVPGDSTHDYLDFDAIEQLLS